MRAWGACGGSSILPAPTDTEKSDCEMCLDMNLKHHMIHKSSPNENALIERSFRTDEELKQH